MNNKLQHIEEVDDSEFESLLAEQRHKDFMRIMQKLLSVLSVEKKIDLSEFINNDKELISSFILKLNEISKPEINIQNKNEEIVSLGKSIIENQKSISEKQDKLITILENKPIKLKVNRTDYTNLISNIEIEYGLITYKK